MTGTSEGDAYVKKWGNNEYGDKADAEIYAKSLAKSEGGNWEATQLKSGQWRAQRTDGGIAPEHAQAIKDFPRDTRLKGKDAQVQEASIKSAVVNKDALVKQYLKENGNIVNTDNARKLFSDVGYTGNNSASVHEASSFISNAVFDYLLSQAKPGEEMVVLAGGSGSGKTSATKQYKDSLSQAIIVVDGNLSKYESAKRKIDAGLEKGLKPVVYYVYREPVQAWKGTITRMLGEGPDKGRVVPLTTFLENHPGSLDVVRKLRDQGIPTVHMDNSFGAGQEVTMTGEQFKKLTIPTDLEGKLVSYTEGLAKEGKLNKDQYESLLNGVEHKPYTQLAKT